MGVEILLGLALVSTAGAAVYANEAADAQRDAARNQEKQNKLTRNRQKIEQIRASRSAYAASQLAAANQGATNSSGKEGGTGSIVSQLGQNLGFGLQMERLSDQAAEELGKASKFRGYSSIFSSVSNLALQGAGYAANSGSSGSGVATVSSIFGEMSEDTLNQYGPRG